MAKKYAHIDWRGLKALRLNEIDASTLEPMKQETIAAAANMDQSYYSRLEKGKVTSPKQEYIDALARVFKVSPHELLDELPRKDPTKSAPDKVEEPTTATAVNIHIPKYSTACELKDFAYTGGVLVDQKNTIQAPPSVQNVRTAYAVQLPTNENAPKYMQGDVVYVNPETSVVGSDDVVVQLHYTDHTILLVRKCVRIEPLYSEDGIEDPEPGFDVCTHNEWCEWLYGNSNLPTEVEDPGFEKLIRVMEMFTEDVSIYPQPERALRPSQIQNKYQGYPERIEVHVIVSHDNARFGHGKSKFDREREEKEANLQGQIVQAVGRAMRTKVGEVTVNIDPESKE